ncbi:MAG: helix-turn-helix domain-containing protein [Alphaproteobacteria bacterium]|nr:helix-turn-helix domain-containing protein [Alphaproteobacteria bacterium]
MARAALRWSVRELATRAGVAVNAVVRVENGRDTRVSTVEKVEAALRPHVVFLSGNGEGPGVRVRKTPPLD